MRAAQKYRQQSWARTGLGHNNQLEWGKFSKSFCYVACVLRPPTNSKPARKTYIHIQRCAQKNQNNLKGIFTGMTVF